jgi:hypothetical protein
MLRSTFLLIGVGNSDGEKQFMMAMALARSGGLALPSAREDTHF